jgi:hypothetical protein
MVGLSLVFGGGCSEYAGADWASVGLNDTASASKVVLDYNLQNYIPIPVREEAPVKSLRRGDMNVTVLWKILRDDEELDVADPFDSFAQGTVYRAYITMEVRNNYAFDQGSNFFYLAGVVETPPGFNPDPRCRILTPVTYKATTVAWEVDDLNLTDYIHAPQVGATPDSSVSGPQYSGLVIWKPNDPTFKADETYEASASLYPRAGFFFGEGPFTHDAEGAQLEATDSSTPNVTIKISFPALPAAPAQEP